MTEITRTAPGARLILSGRARSMIVVAALAALFLGALDALVVGAAMPTIVSELGGIDLYSWVFSAYLLARAVALPIFGKLCDLYSSKKLFILAISIFVISSALAGVARTMTQLIVFRGLQGIGAGGNFALTYFVISDISEPSERGKMMGLISFVWGVSSLMGPPIGGFIVNYADWRWIFFMNLPIGVMAFAGIWFYLAEVRERAGHPKIDYLGALTLSTAVISLLCGFLLAGTPHGLESIEVIALFAVSAISVTAFYHIEKRAVEPILPLQFFRIRSFSYANGSAFLCSFAVFSLSAFYPLFIQGVMGRSPAELGLAMIPLSLGWSLGAWVYGQLSNRLRQKSASLLGSVLLMGGSALSLSFTSDTSLSVCSLVLTVAGLGMGFVSISTLLVVQNSLDARDLGVATASHQFARTLGGTIGIGVAGGLVSYFIKASLLAADGALGSPGGAHADLSKLLQNLQSLFSPEVQAGLSETAKTLLSQAVASGLEAVFWIATIASGLSLIMNVLMPASTAAVAPSKLHSHQFTAPE